MWRQILPLCVELLFIPLGAIPYICKLAKVRPIFELLIL